MTESRTKTKTDRRVKRVGRDTLGQGGSDRQAFVGQGVRLGRRGGGQEGRTGRKEGRRGSVTASETRMEQVLGWQEDVLQCTGLTGGCVVGVQIARLDMRLGEVL